MTFGIQFATRFSLIFLLLALSGCSSPVSKPVSTQLKYEPAIVKLEGMIVKETFPGQPNYESIAKGDAPEDYWILHLDKPIDVAAGPDEMSPAETNVQKIQLGLDEGDYQKYRAFLNQTVSVTGTLFPQISVHDKTAVLIEVKGIELAK